MSFRPSGWACICCGRGGGKEHGRADLANHGDARSQVDSRAWQTAPGASTAELCRSLNSGLGRFSAGRLPGRIDRNRTLGSTPSLAGSGMAASGDLDAGTDIPIRVGQMVVLDPTQPVSPPRSRPICCLSHTASIAHEARCAGGTPGGTRGRWWPPQVRRAWECRCRGGKPCLRS